MTSAVPPDQSHDPEKVSFLLKEKGENGANSNGVEARVKIVEGGKADDDSTSSGGNNNNNNNNNSDKGCLDRRCCGGCCSWKRFLTTSAVIFGLLLVVFVVSYVHYKAKYAGTAEAASADEIIARFSEDQTKVLNISGNYQLSTYDDQYDEYLRAVGVPGFVVSLILTSGFNELISVEVPKNIRETWTWTVTKSSGVQESWFRLGQEFKVKYGSKVFGVKHKVCDLNGTNVLICDVEERDKGWSAVEVYTFGAKALVQEIQLPARGIATLRYFEKKTDEELDEEEESESAAETFFNDDTDDDEFWNSDY